MPVLIDTNILLRSAQLSHPLYEVADRAVKILTARNENLFVSIQNIAEFWKSQPDQSSITGLVFQLKEQKKKLPRLTDNSKL